jgi:hypothetical protein
MALYELARATGSEWRGKASWRVLIRRIAIGELKVVTNEDNEVSVRDGGKEGAAYLPVLSCEKDAGVPQGAQPDVQKAAEVVSGDTGQVINLNDPDSQPQETVVDYGMKLRRTKDHE